MLFAKIIINWTPLVLRRKKHSKFCRLLKHYFGQMDSNVFLGNWHSFLKSIVYFCVRLNYYLTGIGAFITRTPWKFWALKYENDHRKVNSPIDSQAAKLVLPCWIIKVLISDIPWKNLLLPVYKCIEQQQSWNDCKMILL